MRPFRFRMMSVTSSRTPGTDVNSWATPSILTEVTAAPSREESRTRLRLLPNVYPNPRSSGSTTNVPSVSPTSSDVIFGMISSNCLAFFAGSHVRIRGAGAPRGAWPRCVYFE
jgi:hypothetical protein